MGIIKDGHEYIKIFRSPTIVENHLCITQDNDYYYYACDSNWKGNTELHDNEIVLCNDLNKKGEFGTIGMIVNKSLRQTKNSHWEEETHQSYADSTGQTTREYSKDAFEVIYHFIDSRASRFHYEIGKFATIKTVQTYFKEIAMYERKINNMWLQIDQLSNNKDKILTELQDFRENKSYDMLYVEPYKEG